MPLNGDAHNQGVLNISPTVSGGTWDSGKIGKCYNGGGSGYIQSDISITLNMPFTFAVWFKVNSFNTAWAKIFGFYKNGNEYCGLCYSNTNTIGFHIYDDVSGTRTKVFDNYYITSSYATVGTWVHTAIVYDGTYVKQYINGELINTGTIVSGMQVNDTYTTLGLCTSINGTYKPDCCLNDFRFYNHALTDKEVKDISKGLIAHYPLNRRGFGQNNLVTNSSSEWSSWYTPTVNGTNQTSNPGAATLPETKAVGDIYSCQVEIEFSGVTVGSGGTFAFRAQGNTTSGWVGGNPWSYLFYSGTAPSDGVYKYTWTGAIGTNSVSDTLFNCGFRADYWGSGKYRVRCIKMEAGSKATPWIPNSSQALYSSLQLDGTTEYDVSGFRNNGTKTGTFTYTSDTPKYDVSTIFTKSNHIDVDIPYIGNQWSYGAWVYAPISTDGWQGVIILNTDGGDADMQLGMYVNPNGNAIQNTANGQYNSTISWNYGAWHHFFGTFDGSSLKTYIDGVLVNTKSITNTLLERHKLSIGARRRSSSHDALFNGKISDCRIYATVLSDADVLELYNGY